jgi:catechol 2,3-dioxygenase-like lactoylglutathione lyase family enzyme
MNQTELHPHAYVLAVHDLVGSTAYFRDVLGFVTEWRDEDRWQALRRGQVRVNLGRCPDALSPAELGDHNYFGFFATDDVDLLYAEFIEKGAIVVSAPADKPWGWREMGIATPEGHRMMFAQAIQ